MRSFSTSSLTLEDKGASVKNGGRSGFQLWRPRCLMHSYMDRIHCFENVNVLIFLVAISEYDQTLYEDSDINRMNEAAGLFESISNSRYDVAR